MNTPAQARVDLDAIRGNVAVLRERAPGAQVMAVVKADGYGHGLIPSATAALAGGADWLGVAQLSEGLDLRAAGVDGKVLCLLGTPGEPYANAIRGGIDLAVGAVWLVEEIVRAAQRAGRPARLHLKVDTGLSRGGASAYDWPTAVDAALAAQASGYVEIVGLWSHLACADEPGHPSIGRQIAAFQEAIDYAEKAGARPEVRHIANSAAALTVPEARYD